MEWREGKVESLVPDRLDVAIRRGHGVDDQARVAQVRAVGERWSDVALG